MSAADDSVPEQRPEHSPERPGTPSPDHTGEIQMPPEQASKLIDEIKAVAESRGEDSEVHELVERHGGKIDCETKIGEGTTFTVRLPRQIQLTERKRSA